MEIAKGISSNEYKQLKLHDNESSDWNKAIDIFERRINERFIEPVDKLLEIENDLEPIDRKYGFTILAIDCMLLETLQAFYEGLPDTINKSKDMFVKFLSNREYFKEYFDTKLAEEFYYNYRCGILHQTEIKKDDKLWSIGKLVIKNENGIIINRTEFHNRIKEEFHTYIKKLSDKTNTKLRLNFIRKMDFISRK